VREDDRVSLPTAAYPKTFATILYHHFRLQLIIQLPEVRNPL
jgi:hypothetical protein